MPNLTEMARNVKIGTDDLVIKGTRLNNVDGVNITAKYGTGTHTTLGSFDNPTNYNLKTSWRIRPSRIYFSSSLLFLI